MMTTLYATYDGEVLRPEGAVPLAPDTRVRITIAEEPAEQSKKGEPYCSLRAMLAANVDGPPDWSERIHDHLYGEGCRRDE